MFQHIEGLPSILAYRDRIRALPAFGQSVWRGQRNLRANEQVAAAVHAEFIAVTIAVDELDAAAALRDICVHSAFIRG
jgi:hypothetical protein